MASEYDYYTVEVTRDITESARIAVRVPKGAGKDAAAQAALELVESGAYPQGAFEVDDVAGSDPYIADEVEAAVEPVSAEEFDDLTEAD